MHVRARAISLNIYLDTCMYNIWLCRPVCIISGQISSETKSLEHCPTNSDTFLIILKGVGLNLLKKQRKLYV